MLKRLYKLRKNLHDSHILQFTSDDRTSINDMQQYRFSTPVKNYVNINGRNVISYGEAIWHYSDGAFTYGKFNLKEIEYNTSQAAARTPE